ncbi:MAG TPA: sigma-70 family RNA polymerase sigma factor [Bryobacteraceae bacterium]|nr:sigma-70 family RNA polymerase sigma factor [Bryobacteraceae bacterium]
MPSETAGVGAKRSSPTTVRLPLYYRSYQSGGQLERQVFDREYIDRLSRGDREVEGHFTRYFGDLLLIKLRGRLRSPQMAEDARQETFVRVLNRLRTKGSIEHPERLGAFVNRVCDNILSEMFRTESRFKQIPENAPEQAGSLASPESQFVTAERKELVREVLAKLSDADRLVLRRVFLDERDKDEVAKELGMNRDYLRVRIHRALARFRAALAKRDEPGRMAKSTGA